MEVTAAVNELPIRDTNRNRRREGGETRPPGFISNGPFAAAGSDEVFRFFPRNRVTNSSQNRLDRWRDEKRVTLSKREKAMPDGSRKRRHSADRAKQQWYAHHRAIRFSRRFLGVPVA
jgi:hypothetical protein